MSARKLSADYADFTDSIRTKWPLRQRAILAFSLNVKRAISLMSLALPDARASAHERIWH